MINIDFTEEEMQALNYERFHHPDPHVQRKMEAILLKSQKLSHKDICRLTGISPNTLRGYLRAYLKGGIEALKELNLFIKAPSGRERFNVLGASNVVTHELTTVTNDTYINAQSFCDLLWCIARINI